MGGLIGDAANGSVVSNTYALGAVTGPAVYSGGLVGIAAGGTGTASITTSYSTALSVARPTMAALQVPLVTMQPLLIASGIRPLQADRLVGWVPVALLPMYQAAVSSAALVRMAAHSIYQPPRLIPPLHIAGA